jgi:hypothetical protein
MDKKVYSKPEIIDEDFQVEDVIAASGTVGSTDGDTERPFSGLF